jgi:hypothetical protein
VSRQSRSSSISSQARSAHTRPSFDHTIRRRVPDKDNVEDRAGRVRLPTHINILWKRCTDKDIAPTSLPWCVMIYLPLMSCERSIVCITRRETPDTPHSPHRPNSRSRRVPQIINVWRPLRGPVLDSPLGLCDIRSVEWEKDLVVGKLLYRDR